MSEKHKPPQNTAYMVKCGCADCGCVDDRTCTVRMLMQRLKTLVDQLGLGVRVSATFQIGQCRSAIYR